jgi:hypothetical protein
MLVLWSEALTGLTIDGKAHSNAASAPLCLRCWCKQAGDSYQHQQQPWQAASCCHFGPLADSNWSQLALLRLLLLCLLLLLQRLVCIALDPAVDLIC